MVRESASVLAKVLHIVAMKPKALILRMITVLTLVMGISKVCILCMCNCFLSGNNISLLPVADTYMPTN